MVQIIWLASAKTDLKQIFDFISEDSKRFAKYQIIKIKNSTSTLKTFPNAGKEVLEYPNEKIKELVESNYRIIYKIISPSLIHILMVHHGARLLSKRFND